MSPTPEGIVDVRSSPTKSSLAAAKKYVNAWFESSGRKPFAFQRDTWLAYLAGSSGLVHSATGSGKTLAVWLGPVIEAIAHQYDLQKKSRVKKAAQAETESVAKVKKSRKSSAEALAPLTVLWITPLRALAADTEQSLATTIEELKLPWVLERRTGDSSSAVKARQRNRLPTALITTPESLSLLLSYPDAKEKFSTLKCVVVDEWHELLSTKRGTQTELGLARLRRWCPELRVWGLSATLGNTEEAVECLLGPQNTRPIQLIRGKSDKKLEIHSVLPPRIERFPWAGHIGSHMVEAVAKEVDAAGCSLIFTNTRSQTEIWYHALLNHRPDWAGLIALHHGSLDPEVRGWVEQQLRVGKLKAVVCTSSLDLGVDFTPVDRVFQVGSPKGIARLLQRAGRSGHQPGATSQLWFVPTHALELVELAAARDAIEQSKLEPRRPLTGATDVLCQHAVTIAAGGGFRADDLLGEVRQSFAYESIDEGHWQWILRFITRGGDSLAAYPEFHRVTIQENRYQLDDPKIAKLHRMAIGTIASDASMQVQYVKGGRLGTIEEAFVSRLKPQDRFLFGGKLLELVRIRDQTAWVRRAKGAPTAIPRWYGGRMPLSSELSAALRSKIREAVDDTYRGPEMIAVKPILELQKRWSALPRENELLVEQVQSREGSQLFCYPLEGRMVHEGLAAIVALRLTRREPITFTMAANDYGFVLQSTSPPNINEKDFKELFNTENLMADILSSLNETEMAKRQFRQIARVAGLIHHGYPGQAKSMRHLQASSNLFFDVFREYDPENRLLKQSHDEVLDQQLEHDRMVATIDRIEQSTIKLCQTDRLTPMAFPLYVDRLRERLSSESLAARVRKLQEQLEKAAGNSV